MEIDAFSCAEHHKHVRRPCALHAIPVLPGKWTGIMHRRCGGAGASLHTSLMPMERPVIPHLQRQISPQSATIIPRALNKKRTSLREELREHGEQKPFWCSYSTRLLAARSHVAELAAGKRGSAIDALSTADNSNRENNNRKC